MEKVYKVNVWILCVIVDGVPRSYMKICSSKLTLDEKLREMDASYLLPEKEYVDVFSEPMSYYKPDYEGSKVTYELVVSYEVYSNHSYLSVVY
jgi:hypothetical protein